MVKQSEQRLAL